MAVDPSIFRMAIVRYCSAILAQRELGQGRPLG